MIKIIAAVAENNVIGKDNDLIWHISDDLKRFKKLTMNHPMIMGRKTFESFGKPLPKRTHIIISSQDKKSTEQLIWVKSLEEAIAKAKELSEDIYIIGGGSIYEQSMKYADLLEITKVYKVFEGDTFFPEINANQWVLLNKIEMYDEKSDLKYSFNTYEKKT